MSVPRVLIISPLRNEAANIERTARAVAAQTRPPDLWLAVDDGSDDATLELLLALEPTIPCLRVLQAPQDAPERADGDRLAVAKEAVAFNWALRQVGFDGYDYVGKLDGDVELRPDYFERLLARFEADPRLGIAGCTLIEPFDDQWRPIKIPLHHVHGAVKLYSRDCFERIGGMQEQLGWDVIDETYARMHGLVTRSFEDLAGRHHRPWGSANGRLRGCARHGEASYMVHYGPYWAALRALKLTRSRPWVLSGFAYLYGYGRAMARRRPRVDDPAFRRFVRGELRQRLRSPWGRFALEARG